MQRIVKRFLLHQQRESDENENDIGEFKQDLQMVRFEMINDLRRTREEAVNLVNNIQNGLLILGDELFKGSDTESAQKFKVYKTSGLDGNDLYEDETKYESKSTGSGLSNHSNSNDSSVSLTKESISFNQIQNTEEQNLNSIETLSSSTRSQFSIESFNELPLLKNLEPIEEDDTILKNLEPIEEDDTLNSFDEPSLDKEISKVKNHVKFFESN